MKSTDMKREDIYVSKKLVKKLANELEKAGLADKAQELRSSDMSKVTYEKEAQYQSLLLQALKAKEGITKTEWEKKIVDKVGNPDGTPTPDCWFSPMCQPALAKIEMDQDPDRDWQDENSCFGFYTYMGEVCILTSDGYDCDFDSFPVDFQKRVWELVESGSYEEE